MSRTVCIFEDYGFSKLLPLVYTRAVYELRCGMSSLLEKVTRNLPKNVRIVLFCRDYLSEVIKEKKNYKINEMIDDDCLFINGRVIFEGSLPIDGPEELAMKDGTIVYARLAREKSSKITPEKILDRKFVEDLKQKVPVTTPIAPVTIINYWWDLVHHNSEEIKKDFKILSKPGTIEGKLYDGVFIISKSEVYIGKNSKIKSGVVLDAESGPIHIDENVTIEPNAVIQGPAYIGKRSIIRPCAKIRQGTSIGEASRVGGEVEESIIHSYSNKQHDGFLGHAYIGMWCNLGAGTNNSDLKNNYGNVKVYVEGKLIDSGEMFVGLAMADHSKSGIGTNFNTGTVVGVSVNIFGGGVPPKLVPSFSWGGEKGFTTYRLEEAIETARIVMERRELKMTPAEENLLKTIFELTEDERNTFIKQINPHPF